MISSAHQCGVLGILQYDNDIRTPKTQQCKTCDGGNVKLILPVWLSVSIVCIKTYYKTSGAYSCENTMLIVYVSIAILWYVQKSISNNFL